MPGLLTLRPLASAAKAAKTTASKNAVSAARAEKGRDERSQGQGARMFKAPPVPRNLPHPAPAAPQIPSALQPVRPLALADPLGEAGKGKAMNVHERVAMDYGSSSGSEHEPNSVCLAEMVFDYIEDDVQVGKCGRARCNCTSNCSAESSNAVDNDDTKSSLGGEIADVLLGLVPCSSVSERSILAEVTSALKTFEEEKSRMSVDRDLNDSTRRWVMTALRVSGYNAAICKSRCEHTGGFPGGDYQYIDVVFGVALGNKSDRIIIDIDFKTQFEIARPTSQYSALLQSLPPIYVGKPDRLQQVVSIMCDAAKRSLKKKGMHLPPWRKPEYIRAKWFSFYLRTTNESSLKSGRSPAHMAGIGSIALRGAGWDSKFTDAMDKSYQRAADSRKSRECNAELGSRSEFVSKPSMMMQVLKHHGEEPEGKVRGANLVGMLVGMLRSDNGAGEFDGSDNVPEWAPPEVLPRTKQQRAAGQVNRLSTILTEAGLTENVKREMHQQQGGLSRQIAMAL